MKRIAIITPTELEQKPLRDAIEGYFTGSDVQFEWTVCGIGAAAAAYGTCRAIGMPGVSPPQFQRPDLLILAGIAGALSDTLPIGEVVLVEREYQADLGAWRAPSCPPAAPPVIPSEAEGSHFSLCHPERSRGTSARVSPSPVIPSVVEGSHKAANSPEPAWGPSNARFQPYARDGSGLSGAPAPHKAENDKAEAGQGGEDARPGASVGVSALRPGWLRADGLPGKPSFPFPLIENMEGAAFFEVCRAEGVPFLELRAISNRVGDARAAWRIPDALTSLASALTSLLQTYPF